VAQQRKTSGVTLRKLTRSEAERQDREEWRKLTSPEKLSMLWDLTVI
jgi:hypothetical protein